MFYLRVHTPIERYFKPFDSMWELYEYLLKNGFSYEHVFEGVRGVPDLHPTWKFGMFTHSEFPMKIKAFIVDSVSVDDIPVLVNKAKK